MGNTLAQQDPQVGEIIKAELNRQRSTLELIASENFASVAVLTAGASVFSNKYAEGYPDHRYYGGCEFADQMENLAQNRAKKLFQAEHVNVQPHGGSQANMAAYFSAMKPGEALLGMNLAHGGHLTHGSPVSFSGRLFEVHSYGVREDNELIDYDDLKEKAERIKPKIIIAGGSAYPRIVDFAQFREAADLAGATLVVDMAHFAGLVAAGLHPSPVKLADIVTSTTHKTLRGPRGGFIMCKNSWAAKIDAQVFPGLQGGPLMHLIAAKAVAFGEALNADFIDYQQNVISNAERLGSGLSDAGLRLVSGGTSTHLLLLDLRSKNITGIQAQQALGKAGITTNKNTIPFDPQPPSVASGLRIGTAAVTTRGLQASDMDQVAEFIVEALRFHEDETALKKIQRKVEAFCQGFPLYPEL